MQNQLEKESSVRKRLQEVRRQTITASRLTCVSLDTPPHSFYLCLSLTFSLSLSYTFSFAVYYVWFQILRDIDFCINSNFDRLSSKGNLRLEEK